ncbi:MAG: hypothetical protein BGO70_10920 [Bacteroidetes bacterium 43-93]|nr:PAS domain-containing protein [Bacteroidota bacterium]OJW95626.1 MAG: hypothetical protein BGO70_10920 [Bacteroidetes bacterium 43-93]
MDTSFSNDPVTVFAATPNFIYSIFPRFAKFIREHHLVAYIKEQIKLSHQFDLPMLKHVAHIPEDQLLEMGIPPHSDFLMNVEQNTLSGFLERSLRQWENDEMEIFGRYDIMADDIILGSHIRKMAMMQFVPLFTTDVSEIIRLVNEIDDYSTFSNKAATDIFLTLSRERIHQHAHFIERLTNTSPGAIYVSDISDNKEIYVSDKLYEILGYDKQDDAVKGPGFLLNLVYPCDYEMVLNSTRQFLNAEDGAIATMDFRMLKKDGRYAWVRSYRSVFKRDKDGIPIQLIGIMLDIDKEKKDEVLLKRNEDQLLEIQELAGLGSYIWDIEQNSVTLSPFCQKILGAPSGGHSELAGKIHPADADRVANARKIAIDNNSIYDIEYRYIVNGKEKLVWNRGAVFFDNGRKMMRGTIMDITERRDIVKSLEKNEQLYRQAQALAHIGSWTWLLEENVLEWSEELYNIYGIDYGTRITPDLLRAMNHPEDGDRVNEIVSRSIETLEPYEFYYRIVLSSGREKIVHANGTVLADEQGNAYKMTGTVQDVTERQRLIEKLQQSEERYKQAQALSHIGNWEWYVDSDEIEWTEELFRIHGIDAEQDTILYEDFISLIHPEDRAYLQQVVDNTLQTGSPYEIIYRIILKDGAIKYIKGIGNVMLDKEGNLLKLFGTAQDITIQKETEMMMHQKNVELAYSNSSLEEFAYVASHDLKEPLRKISTFGDLMYNLEKEKLSPDGRNYLEKIIQSSRRAQTMINDLMALSTIAGNKAFERYDMNEILSEVQTVLEHNIKDKGAVIKSTGLPTIDMVPSQFRQLFQNLLSNSLKFGRTGVAPVIEIKSRKVSASEATSFGLNPQKKYVQITLEDNGIGFENEYAGKIFTIFQRLHGKSEYEGNGIGLSICRKVAENHKGIIYANSTPGMGAVFTLIVPEQARD